MSANCRESIYIEEYMLEYFFAVWCLTRRISLILFVSLRWQFHQQSEVHSSMHIYTNQLINLQHVVLTSVILAAPDIIYCDVVVTLYQNRKTPVICLCCSRPHQIVLLFSEHRIRLYLQTIELIDMYSKQLVERHK